MANGQDVRRAAVALFAAKGYAATGIRELGAAVGINSATLYHHVGGGKPQLLATIMRDCLAELLRAGREALDVSTDPARQLAALVAAHVGFSAMNPLTASVTDQEMRGLDPAGYGELMALRDEYEALFADVLDRGGRAGVFDIADTRLARLALLEMCNGVAHWYRPDGRLSFAQVQTRFIEFAGRVVAADPASWRGLRYPPPVLLDIEPRRGSASGAPGDEVPA